MADNYDDWRSSTGPLTPAHFDGEVELRDPKVSEASREWAQKLIDKLANPNRDIPRAL